jgi:hypothetical protein
VGGRIFSYTSSSLGISAVWCREENEKIKKRGKEKEYFFFLFSNTESARLFSPHCYVRLLPTLRVYTLLRLGGGEAGLGNSQSPAHFFFPFFSSSSSFHLPKNPPSLLFTLCSTRRIFRRRNSPTPMPTPSNGVESNSENVRIYRETGEIIIAIRFLNETHI